MKKCILFAFAAVLLMTALIFAVSAEKDGDFEYTTENGNAIITSYSGTTDTVEIPSNLGGCNVVRIGEQAFSVHPELTGVTIPQTVTSIGSGAFFYCNGLKLVNIPASVKSIEKYAFYDCSGLLEIIIPDTVSEIGEDAFAGCDLLTVKCQSGSYAEQYCKDNSVKYEIVDLNELAGGDDGGSADYKLVLIIGGSLLLVIIIAAVILMIFKKKRSVSLMKNSSSNLIRWVNNTICPSIKSRLL